MTKFKKFITKIKLKVGIMRNFKNCLPVILEHEGGYVNHPKDPGGETNYGITRKTYEEWSGKHPGLIDMREIPMEDVEVIYKTQYWNKLGCDELPLGLDLIVFDFAVNAGVSRAARHLQSMVGGTAVDGLIGPKTIQRVNHYVKLHGVEKTINDYKQRRETYYRKLQTFSTFGKGWLRRNDETAQKAIEMIVDNGKKV